MKLKTIVAAVQTNDDLADAVVVAARHLSAGSAKVHIITAWAPVVPTPVGMTPDVAVVAGPAAQDAVEADRKARAEEPAKLKALAAAHCPGAEIAIVDGDPGAAVSGYAKRVDADVIVTGSHQKGFWGGLLAGAASRDVVRDAPCAVFLVTKPFAKRVLVATRA
jgi:nucleotide-binding universal stress UspA family protein